jgi:hypothetical protein
METAERLSPSARFGEELFRTWLRDGLLDPTIAGHKRTDE